MVVETLVNITPLQDIVVASSSEPLVPFRIYKDGRQVTLQWETFSGSMGASGKAYLVARQSYSGMPAHAVYGNLIIDYAGTKRHTQIVIDPLSSEKIKFYLVFDTPASEVAVNDQVTVYGGSITWLSC